MPMRESREGRAERLAKTGQGRALLELLHNHSRNGLAEKLDVKRGLVAMWIFKGHVSRSGARLIESKLGIKKEIIRPDVDAEMWARTTCGRRIGDIQPIKNHDTELLLDLAIHFGSVNDFCTEAGIKDGDYRNWKSRGRIAAWAVPHISNLPGLTAKLKYRLSKCAV